MPREGMKLCIPSHRHFLTHVFHLDVQPHPSTYPGKKYLAPKRSGGVAAGPTSRCLGSRLSYTFGFHSQSQ